MAFISLPLLRISLEFHAWSPDLQLLETTLNLYLIVDKSCGNILAYILLLAKNQGEGPPHLGYQSRHLDECSHLLSHSMISNSASKRVSPDLRVKILYPSLATQKMMSVEKSLFKIFKNIRALEPKNMKSERVMPCSLSSKPLGTSIFKSTTVVSFG